MCQEILSHVNVDNQIRISLTMKSWISYEFDFLNDEKQIGNNNSYVMFIDKLLFLNVIKKFEA